MNEFTFLEDGQLFGSNQLSIFKQIGTKAAITDFAILLGGFVSNNYYVNDVNSLKNRTGYYWTKSDDGDNDARVVSDYGNSLNSSVNFRDVGARPAFQLSSISNISTNVVSGGFYNGFPLVEYGIYPQMAVAKNMQYNLENAFNIGALKMVGQVTTDSRKYDDYSSSFLPMDQNYYEYKGKAYARVNANPNGNSCTLSNGEKYKTGDYVWVEVQPVRWIKLGNGLLLAEKILFAGVQFNETRNYRTSNWQKTNIYKYLQQFFAKDILQNINLSKNLNSSANLTSLGTSKENNRKKNPYQFNFECVSEEDIIRGAIESNVPVFLHGRSSEGKSARVEQLDPDCEIIYMANASLDSLNGKSVYNSQIGEMIDIQPTWYSKVKKRCEDEPDKIHIIFFDELTNALDTVQGMVFNIILKGEINGKWKLPANARIVAAGNEEKDSLSAHKLSEPLFNRFAHVYITTTVDSWLKWAATPKEDYERLDYREENSNVKIHPSIYSYIAYKSYSGNDVLRTPYTGDKPNADPRKWEMASKILFKTKQPEMLRALIGEALTMDFVSFVGQQVITVEDVINHNYSDIDLEMNLSQKFATACGLSSVSEENFEEVRKFMRKLGGRA